MLFVGRWLIKERVKLLRFCNWTVSIFEKVDFWKKQYIIKSVNLMIYVMSRNAQDVLIY